MNGLLKNNIYASITNIKFFSIAMLIFGTFVVLADNRIPSLLMGFTLFSIIGFSMNAAFALGKENTSKWEKYKLMTPVKKKDIITSYFISVIACLILGIIFAGIVVSLSLLLHGFPFDRTTDILLLFITGINISLFMYAFFFPFHYLGNDEKNEVVLILSLFLAIIITMVLISFINWLLGSKVTLQKLFIGAALLQSFGIVTFLLSYPLTIWLFKRKEY